MNLHMALHNPFILLIFHVQVWSQDLTQNYNSVQIVSVMVINRGLIYLLDVREKEKKHCNHQTSCPKTAIMI